ncbi:MAG: outer membrane protein assembly factor BamD [Candidatus Thiodiazotropha sp.]
MLRKFSIITLVTLLLSGCSMPDQIDLTKNWSASQFYSEAKSALMDGDYDEAIKHYNGLQARFPFGRYATQSQLDIIYAHYKNGEPESAIMAADRFIKLNPQSPYVDYAYYMKGITNYNRNQSIFSRILPSDPSERDAGAALDAFNDFDKLVRRYPDSRYSADARQRMLYLRNNLAKYQIHIAEYYMRRGAYLAAANRANRVVTRFQRTDAMQRALEIMVDAYTRLGMTGLADDARRVLTLNLENGRLNSPAGIESEKEAIPTEPL